MAHLRKRSIEKGFRKALKFWPVVSLLGPRQCGKSTFLRDLLWKKGQFTYVTLDVAATRRRVQDNPELFLGQVEHYPLVIDEAQKSPEIFDEIKARVDEKKIPGRYVLSGSVKFSKKIGIRESLTGRTATLFLDTMTLSETAPTSTTLDSVVTYLDRGGMPGVCFIREKNLQADYWNQWLETLCEQDLMNFSKGRLSPDLARRILEELGRLEWPDRAHLAKATRQDARRIENHLQALEALFVVRKVEPHPKGVGKTLYFPFDSGLAHQLGANLRRKWQCWFLVETINQARFTGKREEDPMYYLTSRGSYIDFVLKDRFYLYTDLPHPERPERMTVAAAAKANPQSNFYICNATKEGQGEIGNRIFTMPWTGLIKKPF